jgi:hypothetical protein
MAQAKSKAGRDRSEKSAACRTFRIDSMAMPLYATIEQIKSVLGFLGKLGANTTGERVAPEQPRQFEQTGGTSGPHAQTRSPIAFARSVTNHGRLCRFRTRLSRNGEVTDRSL